MEKVQSRSSQNARKKHSLVQPGPPVHSQQAKTELGNSDHETSVPRFHEPGWGNPGQRAYSTPPVVMAKMAIGKAGDAYEREADQVAEKVTGNQPGPVSISPIGAMPVQRMCPDCAEEQQGKSGAAVQGAGLANSKGGVSKGLENRIQKARGQGTPMAQDVKGGMEQGFGSNFDQVRIHTGSEAVQMNQELGAKAFTVGNDVFFNQGQYAPGTGAGKKLLAHELTHTVQQSGGTKQQNTAQAMIQKVDLTSGPVEGLGPGKNEVGQDSAGNVIYGVTDFVRGQLMYTGECYSLANNATTPVPCPTEGRFDPAKRTLLNCGSIALGKSTWQNLPDVKAHLDDKTKCVKLASKNDPCPSGYTKKCFLWTFKIKVSVTDPTTGKVRSQLMNNVDFHIVCGDKDGNNAISKDGKRPGDPRIGPAEIFAPVPYIYENKNITEQLVGPGGSGPIQLDVYCCK